MRSFDHRDDAPPGNVLFDVWRLDRALVARMDEAFEGTSMTGGDYGLYSLVRYAPGRAVGEYADRAGMPISTASRRLQALVRRGHAESSADPDDGRVRRFSLTDEGIDAHESVRPRFLELLADVEAVLGEDLPLARTGLQVLEDALRGEVVAEPTRQPTTTLAVGGVPLTSRQEAEVRQFISWVRHRDRTSTAT